MTKEELLQSFCDDSANRPGLNEPFLQGDWVCATDAYVALLMKADDADTVNYNEKAKPAIVRFTQGELKPVYEFDAKDFAVAYYDRKNRIDAIDRRCPECKGKRMVEYHYWDRFSDPHMADLECPCCKGTGEIDINDYLRKSRYQFKIDEKYCLTFHVMRRIVELAEYFNLQKIVLSHDGNPYQPYHIVGGSFHAVIALALYDPDADDED